MSETEQQRNLVIVTGLSGAGLSSSLKHLEDMGYEVHDNFPLPLVESLLNDQREGNEARLAIGIDTRTRGFDTDVVIRKAQEIGAALLFLTADESVLQKRFTETRRRHPLAKDRPPSAGIKKEMSMLFPLREAADLVIDTSALSIHDLRKILEGHFKLQQGTKLTVSLISFGFRYGLPREADIVMDVRFLKNPHWIPDLKPRTGLEKEVGDYIEEDDGFAPFMERFLAMLDPLLERYAGEGKSYLTIAIGCTGGRHRSVYTVEKLANSLSEKDINLNSEHRDIGRTS